MKNLIRVALVSACFLFIGSFARAQSKVGYINFDALVAQLPEAKTVKTQIETYQKQFLDQLTIMNTELQAKAKDFQTNGATMTDAVRTSKQAELQDMNKRMQDYQNNARDQVEAKSNELIKPLSDKVKAAVTAVAKEKGYNYVFNTAQVQFIVSPDTDDLTEAVKAKLGLK
jgi:outer membrane protein